MNTGRRSTAVALLTLTVLIGLTGAAAAEVVKPQPGTHAFVTTDALVPVLDGPTDTHQGQPRGDCKAGRRNPRTRRAVD